MEELLAIGTAFSIKKETDRAVLFQIGTDNFGRPITRYIPKSQMYIKNDAIYIPKWLARKVGIWDYVNEVYLNQGYQKMFDDCDDLPF